MTVAPVDDPRADRSQRRRQEHRVQPDHRRHPAHVPARSSSRASGSRDSPRPRSAGGASRARFRPRRLFREYTVLHNVLVAAHLLSAPGLVRRSCGRAGIASESDAPASAAWRSWNASPRRARRSGGGHASPSRPEGPRARDGPRHRRRARDPGRADGRAGRSGEGADDERAQRLARRDSTVLLVEHDMKAVMGVCDTVTVLDHGLRIAEGERHVRSRPTRP